MKSFVDKVSQKFDDLYNLLHGTIVFLVCTTIVVIPIVLSYYQFEKHADIAHTSIFLSCASLFLFVYNFFREYPGPIIGFLALILIQGLQCIILWLPSMGP